MVEEKILISTPPLVGEDLHLAVAGEAGGVHPAADFADVDAALTHEAAVVEKIGRRRFQIADMEGVEATGAASEVDLLFQLGVPPDVIDIDGDTEHFR